MYIPQDYIIENRVNTTEYDLLMLYAILGLIMLIGANDFATIFLVLELQSLSLYMLSGFKSNSIYLIESGLKYYFIFSVFIGTIVVCFQKHSFKRTPFHGVNTGSRKCKAQSNNLKLSHY